MICFENVDVCTNIVNGRHETRPDAKRGEVVETVNQRDSATHLEGHHQETIGQSIGEAKQDALDPA